MPNKENTARAPEEQAKPEPSGWVDPEPKQEAAQASGGPEVSSVQKDLERPSAEEIYQQVARSAKNELKRSSVSLAVSGFTGGTFMGLSALGTGIMIAVLGTGPVAFVVSRMFYPIGFIVVMIGRSQLFTENTLYPVALVLSEKKEFWNTLRLWSLVLPSNVLGAFAFAMLMAKTHAVPDKLVAAISGLGVAAAQHPATAIFWSAVVAGWIIATAAWLVSGSHSITGAVALIWMLTFVVGLGNFAHCIATSSEMLVSVLTHNLPWIAYARWLGLAVSGNICGGVVMVTLLEYGQVMQGESLQQETDEADGSE